MVHEVNISDNYRAQVIYCLGKFSIYFKNAVLFKDMTREDLLTYLNSFRKPENDDLMHKWIGTYNMFRINLIRFFKWLYYPDIPPQARSKPSIIENIPKLKRKEQSIYKPTDMWSPEDDSLFLRFSM